MVHAEDARRLAVVTGVQTCPLPILDTDTVNPAWSPAETEEASAILAMDTSPQFTAKTTWLNPRQALEADEVVWLCKLGHSALRVGVTPWTEAEAPAARVAGP